MSAKGKIDPKRLRRLLRKLIDIYSPSGKEEEILGFLEGYLKRRNIPFDTQDVDDYRYNIIVTSDEDNIELAFVGHLDTVTAYDLDHYEHEEEGDMISGLGAADMKGGCAAMIEAFLSLYESGDEVPPVALTLVVGEEEDGDGAAELVRDYQFPWAIIGEPTNLAPCLSHFGYLEVGLSTKGKRAHASLAHKGQTPVEVMLKLALALTRYLEKKKPELIYNIRDLYSSRGGFIVPDVCETWIDIHLPPGTVVGELMSELEEVLNKDLKKSGQIEWSMRYETVDSGYELPQKGPVIESMMKVYEEEKMEWSPQPFRSHSDANQLWEAGVRPVILGPGNLGVAHSPDESISFSEVEKAAEIYASLARKIVKQ